MKRTFKVHSGNYYIFQNVRFTLNMLLGVRKTCVNEHTVNMRYSIHVLNVFLTCIKSVAPFPVYYSAIL